ncbi:MAG: glycogen/starch synthase [Treponema sp.]|nr:glycogen/starch synthase [Treponema sp.]
MRVWIVSREYAGVAEAGGVKNVACSLSENLVKLGNHVTLFIPLYGCTDISSVKDYLCVWHKPVQVKVGDTVCHVCFAHGYSNGVEIVFICHRAFSEKMGVYTYTRHEEMKDPSNVRGSGHKDTLFLNVLYQKAAVLYGQTCEGSDSPEIVHCQDAAAALFPVLMENAKASDKKLKSFYSHTRCVVTIHNAGPGYHHAFENVNQASWYTGIPQEKLVYGLNGCRVEPFLLAAETSAVTTVSPQYAEEIMSGDTETDGLSEEFRKHKIKIYGITNGIDVARYDPTDTKISLLPYAFAPEKKDLGGKLECRNFFLEHYALKSAQSTEDGVQKCGFLDEDDEDCVYIAYHGRVVAQKGISVLVKAAEILVSQKLPVRFIIAGQGQPELEKEIENFALSNPGKCVYFKGYSRFLSRLSIAAADFAVFPSFFEPCGLEDLIAQIYGTIPVAHATGGLCKIIDDETGFLYRENKSEELAKVLHSLVVIKARAGKNIFNSMIAYTAENVRRCFSWETVTKDKYIPLYNALK